MTDFYWEADVNPKNLENMTIAVLGYGSQGRAHALNLRDSGATVQLGLRRGASWDMAVADRWQPTRMESAVVGADLVAFLVPDLAQPELFHEIKPHLHPKATLLFAHGFNVHFGFLDLPPTHDVVMVAPKGPGHLVRRQYTQGCGVPCLAAVHQDTSGCAFESTLAYAHGIGGTRAGVVKTTFAEETNTDLFGEQAVLCGGATELVLAGFETLVDAGYKPEVAYFECLHELKLIVDLLYEGGLEKMHRYISDTAKYGDLTRGPRIVDREVRDRMKAVLKEIESGEFAREWRDEYAAGGKNYRQLLDADLDHRIEDVGKTLRSHMNWLNEPAEANA